MGIHVKGELVAKVDFSPLKKIAQRKTRQKRSDKRLKQSYPSPSERRGRCR